MHTQESGKGMKKLRNNKIRKLLAFMVALALMVSCMPSAYTISASEAFGDGTEDIFTDGEFTSEPAAEESTPDVSSADQEETEQAQQSTLTYENDSVKVTAEALEDGALPQNTALKADGVNENSSVSYDTVSQKLSAAATDKGSSLRGFFAYDVYFADGDGNRVEPNGRVRVTFEYKTPAAPELTDAASTSVTVEKLHYNNSTGDTDVNTLQANEDLKVLNVNEGKQIQTLQVETGNAAVFAVMWDSPETPAAENPEVTPEAEPSEAPAENPDAEPTEAPAEDPDVVEEPAEDIASPDEVPAADENGETSLIEVLGDDTNLRVSPSIEAEVLATVNAGTQLTLLDTVTAEDGATWYKVSWEGTEAYIRSDMAQVVDSSDEAEEPEDVQEEEIQPEITRYDYTSDEVNVKVTLTDPADLPDNAELSVTPVELSQEAEDQITEEAIKEKKAIEKIHSYDIKFLVDGEEVQPGATVKVSVSLNDEKKIKDADVYHVDENDNVENMDGSVAKNGDVEFETTHFSTYVIVNNSLSSKVTVTLQHYCDDTKIYADTVRHIEVGGKIPDYRATENYNIDKVVVVKDNGEETPVHDIHEVQVASDTVVKIYYIPKPSTEESGDVVFYDYQVKPKKNNNKGINDLSHYQKRDKSNMMIMGTQKQTGLGDYNAYGDNGKNANIYVENDNRVTTGLVTGLSNDYKEVVWKVDQPGFFTDDNLGEDEGKEKYTSYKLLFSKTGNNYKLTGVKQPGGGYFKCNDNGSYFYPLKDPIDDGTERGQDYFGMRYDIEFKLGDYVGPLNYKFTGDDDLWVLLDGKKVVIDVGGIHKSIESSADLWKDLGFKEGIGAPTDEEKNKTHRITVLYMERGAYESNCKMDFTIPDARFVNVENVPLADLTLTKVDSKGNGISGAKFKLVNENKLVNDNGGETYPITTSDDKGSVTFNNLKEGTYTLTETMAPNGYEASQESWIVKVTSSDDKKAVATLYKADGKTKIEKDPDSSYHIMNYTQEEIIKASMDYSKTATVNDWDKRTYDINITAASTSTSTITTTEKAVADIMLVLDVSGSMDKTIEPTEYKYVGDNTSAVRKTLNTDKTYYVEVNGSYKTMSYWSSLFGAGEWYIENTKASRWSDTYKIYKEMTRLDALKNSVDQFITDTASKSPKSKIGITAFSSEIVSTKDLVTVGEVNNGVSNKDALIAFADALNANGGTKPSLGLNKAKESLDSESDGKRSKYVILFTDGAPTGDNMAPPGSSPKWDTTEVDNAENAAEALKSKGYTVYTIGYGLDDKAKTFLAGGYYRNTKYNGIASPKCAFNAENATQLGDIFKDIQNTITHDISITGAIITDIIDPRFELLKDDGTLYTQDDLNNGVEVNGGTVSLVNGNYQIQWTDQTIPNKKKGEWNKTIKVKAKDSFIGGNNVTTNVSPGSKIFTGYGEVELQQPKVNVKSDLVVNNNKKTIFYGDTVPTEDDILNVLFNKTQPQGYVTQLDGKKKLVTYTIGADGQEIKPEDFTLTWYKDEACTKEIKVEDMANVVPKPDSKQYYLKVTYISGKSDGSGVLTAHYYSQEDTNREYGVYTINIITGQIQIIKKLETKAKEPVTFDFDVKKDNKKIATATATIAKGSENATATFTLENDADAQVDANTPALIKLSRGVYTVTESEKNTNYTLKEVVAGKGTNCKKNIIADKQIEFSIGTYTNNDAKDIEVLKNGDTEITKGRIGVAVFTNEKSVADVKLVKVDAADKSVTIRGARFALYEANENWSKASLVKEDIVSGNNGRIDLNAIPVGNYLLEETEAATGYSLPTNPWRVTVEGGGTVKVMDGNGHAVDVDNVSENGTTIYQITNTKVYSLPESGGPGTYGFTISGVAILATALLLFIKNKRREEEAKRS